MISKNRLLRFDPPSNSAQTQIETAPQPPNHNILYDLPKSYDTFTRGFFFLKKLKVRLT